VFHRFVQAKYADGGLILGLSQLSLLSKLPLKTTIDLKVVNIDNIGCKVIQNITLLISLSISFFVNIVNKMWQCVTITENQS